MKNLLLVDVHAHLEEIPDLAQTLTQARRDGVTAIIGVGVNAASNSRTLKIAEENPGYVYPALGIHPWQIKEEEIEKELAFIRKHIEECVALGEIGLDYKVKIKKDLQWKVFGALLDIACEHKKPVVIHCRFSQQHALKMVKERVIRKAVFHWYSGPLDILDEILASGYFISATPALAYSPPHQAAIRRAPLERILLETDTPVSYQGREARPKDVTVSLEQVCRLKKTDLSEIARLTTENACQLFGISSFPTSPR